MHRLESGANEVHGSTRRGPIAGPIEGEVSGTGFNTPKVPDMANLSIRTMQQTALEELSLSRTEF